MTVSSPLRNTSDATLVSWNWISNSELEAPSTKPSQSSKSAKLMQKFSQKFSFDVLKPLRQWLDGLTVKDAMLAHRLCRLIPAQCPFERDITLFGKTLLHIPPMCKLNPLYEEVVALRFRALCYLADECGEDIAAYC